ncbi:exopolysaccharide biosynthesis protein [Hyphococcus sp.]|uniref:exopolysaccharide biosynthesis protein n=1 Tax=Hyphococcus sp. TaxID=2038636 RepID=UPI003D12BE4E
MSDSKKAHSVEDGDAPLESIIDEAIENSENGEVSLRALLKAWDDRSYGPLFILLGFVGGTPLAVVPGAAAVVGVVITLLALQMALGLNHPWLPNVLLKQSISEENLREVRKKMDKPLRFVDHLITERWTWAAGEAMRRAAAIFVAALGIVMVPFDAVPFAVAAPAWTVVLFGVAITARDGLVMVLALLGCLAVGFLGVRAF